MTPRFARTVSVTALISAVLLPVASGQGTMEGPPPPLAAGAHAPAFTTTTVAGKPLTLRSLRGRVVLLDYWATWCGPCRMATPTLQSLHKQYAAWGLAVVGLSVDGSDSLAQVKPFIKQYGMTYLVSASPKANGKAATAYHVSGIPSQYLIDKKGIVRWSQAGYSRSEGHDLSLKISRLLAEKP